MATFKYHLNHPYVKGTRDLKKDPVLIDGVFTISREHRFVISTVERIQPKYWDRKEKCVKSSFTGHHEINKRLIQIKERVMIAWGHWTEAGGRDFEELKKAVRIAVKGEVAAVQKKTLFQALDLFLSEAESGKGRNTWKMYRSLIAKLQEFNRAYPVDFANLDFNFYDAFKRFLYSIPNPAYPGHILVYDSTTDCYRITRGTGSHIGLFDDTVYKYITNLCAFLRWAVDREYPVDKSFEKWEIIKRSYPPIALTKDELDKLEAEPLTGVLAIARDYLALECRTGARISDLQRFDIRAVKDNVWTYIPKKISRLHAKEVKLPFTGYCTPAWWILQRYNFRMPKIAEQTINRNIKEVCRAAGINSEVSITRWIGSKKVIIPGKKYEYITTHTGKKTFITILAENNVPLKVISDLSGTSVQTIIKHYLGKSDSKVIDNYLNQIEQPSLMRKVK